MGISGGKSNFRVQSCRFNLFGGYFTLSGQSCVLSVTYVCVAFPFFLPLSLLFEIESLDTDNSLIRGIAIAESRFRRYRFRARNNADTWLRER